MAIYISHHKKVSNLRVAIILEMVYLSNSSFKNFKYRIKQRKKTVSFWRDKFPRANRNRWQLSSLTWPSRGARKLKHSFNITGTWTVWESPWVQKHRSFWYGNINRLLAQYKDKGLAAILLTVGVTYEATSFWWRSTADMIYRSPKRAHFQNGDCQSTPRWPSGKIARRTQSLEARSSKGR